MDGAMNCMRIVSATMNKYTVVIQIEVDVIAVDEAYAIGHALYCVDEYDSNTTMHDVEVMHCEIVSKECEQCEEQFELDEEWITLCDECLRTAE